MRQIVLDTETTGLEWKKGNRVVEIGCVELLERRPTGRTFHCYLNPEREFEPGAQEVTGLTLEFLADKPKFADVADEFLEFVGDSEMVIHNAAFDLGFLDAELDRLDGGYGRMLDRATVIDSLDLARKRFPGQRVSLDALCRRLDVDNSHRQLHGALLDAQLLSEVYLALTAGQSEIGFGSLAETTPEDAQQAGFTAVQGTRPRVVANAEELQAHAVRIEAIRKKSGKSLWETEAAEAQDAA